MNQPKISVIVPVYNAEKWLRRCVDSILAQTYTDFELLLVDDGSTDSSGAICDEYAALDARIRPFHKPNGGVSSARNLGLDNARGEWIAFCDADDYDDNKCLESLYSATKNDCDLVSCGYHWYKKDKTSGDFVPDQFIGNNKEYLQTVLNDEMFGALWNKLFRKLIIDIHNLRLDTQLKFREDEEFLLRYLTYCRKCRTVSKVLYYYFMPGWNKYFVSFSPESGLYLLSRLRHSIKSIGYGGMFAKKLKHEQLCLLLSSIKHQPKNVFKYMKMYIQSLK